MIKKFAFLVHPTDDIRKGFSDSWGFPFGLVPTIAYRKAFETLRVPPIRSASIAYSDRPGETVGEVVSVPLSAPQLLQLPRRTVQAKIEETIDHCAARGAQIVGLGALTAPASLGGKLFRGRSDVAVTNGNAFTAAATYQAVEKLADRLPKDPTIALIGATGSVGGCVAELLARYWDGRLMLMARHQGRLQKLSGQLQRPGLAVTTHSDLSEVGRADLVIVLTSATGTVLGSEHLKKGAVVLDGTYPKNTSRSLIEEREDVLVVDGGLIEVPAMAMRGGVGLPDGLVYACLAETMLLSLEGRDGHFSIGTPTADQAEYCAALARKHADLGFHLAPFLSFGRRVEMAAPRSTAPSLFGRIAGGYRPSKAMPAPTHGGLASGAGTS